VEIAQVARSVEAFGDRYLARIFTADEIGYCLSRAPDSASHLAARFAAKEATFKALRTGDVATDWRSVEIRRSADGSCEIVLHGGMRTLADRLDVDVLSVSLSHDGAYASAVVIGHRRRRSAALVSRIARKRPRGAYER
jgi:holo-[acyl-carrier protein] synthase